MHFKESPRKSVKFKHHHYESGTGFQLTETTATDQTSNTHSKDWKNDRKNGEGLWVKINEN